jgi:Cof subfamily protein (haloacid dehalogenase superfamily)
MKMLIEPLKLETPVAGFNGGVFTRPDLSVLSSRTLAPDVAAEALELIKKNGLDAWLYTATDWYIPKEKGPHVERETWTVKFNAKVEPDLKKYADQAVKIVGVTDDAEAMKKCEAEGQKTLGERASAQKSQPYYLDITHPQANKGAVADYLAEHFQLKLDEIATLGDMPNDVPMFEKAGVSIAMGQSSPEVQKAATFVTASYEDEGFAQAIEQHFLS